MAFNLKQKDYSCHAIHNNTAAFYGRDVVFSNLGFDDYDAIETMPGIERNALGWAKDKVLYREINSALNSTEGRDYIFAVSVQGHGKYPDEDILSGSIALTSVSDAYDDSTIYGLKYYTTQLNEMDAFVGSLVSCLAERKEKTVLVLYGDHLPGFNFEEGDLNAGSLLQTEYVIWTNFDLPAIHKDLYSYQLSAYVQALLGMHEGLITRLHQVHFTAGDEDDIEDYLHRLRVLSYDMLYGEKYCWEGVNPYTPTEMTFGYYNPSVESLHVVHDAANNEDYLTVYGHDYTPYCMVTVDGTRYKETIYVSDQELFLPRVSLTDGCEISISIYNNGTLYLQSAPYIYHPETLP